MASKKKVVAVKGRWKPAASEAGVRVRMYRVGFGDFFLVSFLPDAGAPVHVVIDCGVFKGTSQTGDIQSIEAAVEHMAGETGGDIALIIMTHRHADHIAGFARCSATFKKMRVGAVWMPVWESEYEPTAVKFQAELTSTALGLRKHFAGLGAAASPEQDTARRYMENATGEFTGALSVAGGSNASALDLLKRGLGVTPEFYKAGDEPKIPAALVKAGLACQVLGPPPLKDLDLMKLMDLKKNVGQYLAMSGEGEEGEEVSTAPFGNQWIADVPDLAETETKEFFARNAFREWVPGKPWRDIDGKRADAARRKMEAVLSESQPIAALTAAKQLNAFLNNQSLVTLFTFKGKKLLFVGDAQAGNWEHWLFTTDKPDKAASGTMSAVAQEVLGSLNFYKVGHHGSSNATPRAAAEAMCTHGHHFVAMCSTENGVYGTEDPDDPTKGTEVPRIPLLAKLSEQAALVRSDQVAITVKMKKIAAAVKLPMPKASPGTRLVEGELWVDCFL
ncbi:hypothetical protein BWI17_15715 [Betaproteobacteria bacterium GR16-43]|nr:hypothetical protein BWI17_15715 [Betaproteobacteria bacterium GR16-43]